jgi:hypothetical protein
LKTFGGPIRVLSGIFGFAKQFNLVYFIRAFQFNSRKTASCKKRVRVKGKTRVFLVLSADSMRFY